MWCVADEKIITGGWYEITLKYSPKGSELEFSLELSGNLCGGPAKCPLTGNFSIIHPIPVPNPPLIPNVSQKDSFKAKVKYIVRLAAAIEQSAEHIYLLLASREKFNVHIQCFVIFEASKLSRSQCSSYRSNVAAYVLM